VDAFAAARQNISRLAGQAFNIGGGPRNTLSLLELLALLRERFGLQARVQSCDWRTGDQRYYVTDTSRFAAATGWQANTAPHEGVGNLYRWLEEAVPVAAGTDLPLAVSE
jgi:CDP-paratose 2-epimerase